jgi:hypothetical protein
MMDAREFCIPRVEPEARSLPAQNQAHGQQDFTSGVVVPLVQHLLGGIAAMLLAFVFCLGHRATHDTNWQTLSMLWWCFLGGLVVTCLMTIIRFFGDAVGIVTAAYLAGQRSMSDCASEQEEGHPAVQKIRQQNRGQPSAEIRAMEMFARARDNAEQLIFLYFSGKKVDRKSMTGRGMGQRDWERARRLMYAAGVIADDGIFCMQTLEEAIAALNARFAKDANRKHAAQTFVPAWQ